MLRSNIEYIDLHNYAFLSNVTLYRVYLCAKWEILDWFTIKFKRREHINISYENHKLIEFKMHFREHSPLTNTINSALLRAGICSRRGLLLAAWTTFLPIENLRRVGLIESRPLHVREAWITFTHFVRKGDGTSALCLESFDISSQWNINAKLVK